MSGDGSDNDAVWAAIGCDDAEVDFIGNGTAEDVAARKVNRRVVQSTNGLYLTSQLSPSTASHDESSGATKNRMWWTSPEGKPMSNEIFSEMYKTEVPSNIERGSGRFTGFVCKWNFLMILGEMKQWEAPESRSAEKP